MSFWGWLSSFMGDDQSAPVLPSPTRVEDEAPKSDEDYGQSMMVAAFTGSAAAGVAAGGSLAGAMMGELMHDDDMFDLSGTLDPGASSMDHFGDHGFGGFD